MSRSENRIGSLDGLRAVSIVLVMISHLVGIKAFFISERIGRILDLGELGVRVFFVISGFLITSILLKELDKTGSIDLKRFYFRRTLRIFPPYYLFLFVLIAAQAIGLIILNPGDVSHALTYTSNYNPSRPWIIGHTWSLAVEEQFYLLWPALLLLLGKRKGLWLALAFVVVAPAIRLGLYQAFPDVRSGIGQRFETVADSIAMGCLLAGCRAYLHSLARYRQALNSTTAFLATILIVLIGNSMHDHPHINFLAGFAMMNFGIAFCIDWCVTNEASRAGRFLNWRPVAFVGVVSYSIYLWQQPFLDRYSHAAVCQFPLNIAIVIPLALLSYFLCERPSFALRRLLEARIFGARKSAGPERQPARKDPEHAGTLATESIQEPSARALS